MNHSELLGKADLARTAAFFHFYVPFPIVTVLQSFLCLKLLFPFPLTLVLQEIVFQHF